MDKVELEKAQDRIRLCGRNRGDHAYIPLVKKIVKQTERVEIFICIRCFLRVEAEEIFKLFPQTTSSHNLDTIGCSYLS